MIKIFFFIFIFFSVQGYSAAFDVFAKGAVSKKYLVDDGSEWQLNVSASAGFALLVIPRVRLEFRYINDSSLRNQLKTIKDIITTTDIYSLGLDVNILGQQSSFQPFIFVGGGYLISKSKYTEDDIVIDAGTDHEVVGNLGVGFRVQVVKSIAFEVEVFSYIRKLRDPDRLINWYGTAGIRLFI